MSFAGQANPAPGPMPGSLLETARQLLGAIRAETMLARAGDLARLGEAAGAKQAAYLAFIAAGTLRRKGPPGTEDELQALTQITDAAQENAIVLEAVQITLQNFATRLRAALAATIDPGTYGPRGGRVHMAPAARFEASV